ncbi:hypothetical protein NliqN6_1639 [Naganishia liquefaciens]|uniref:Sterol regulatory element-binding protein cleavage-activating protein n=1 Tax=Naganishia liquefaciens TaxID=104408 RepID=A0A8H3TQA5_9TREE|nr:hypothetical protein NliqN6_1639 [Naganishia liquefaciens]
MRRRARNRSSNAPERHGAKAYARGNSRWTLVALYLRWSKWVTEAFKAFGRHCARNQIRVLLIDSFVMTTLFYPALALHIQRMSIQNANLHQRHVPVTRTTGPLSLLSTPLLDSFFPYPDPIIPVPNTMPFWLGDDWSEHFEIKIRAESDDNGESGVIVSPVAWTSMEQLVGLRQGARTKEKERDGGQQLGAEIAHLASNWDSLTAGEMSCVRFNNGSAEISCLSFQGPSITEDIYRSIQPVFRAAPGVTNIPERFAGAWKAALDELAGDNDGHVYEYISSHSEAITYRLSPSAISAKGPTSGDPSSDTAPPANSIPSYIFLLYAAVILYFLFLLSRASAMHSRFGIAFTGVIQVLCSAVMSFSVMAFLGFGWGDTATRNAHGETVVPYYLMPLVILIVGVENMATLLKAIYSTPITYSVPDRIGFGLAKAGPTLFMTSICDIIALCFIAWTVKLGPVRDLCLYASVLIFVDWWMLQTFFLTVVSIDCQRLELADLLRQGVEQPQKLQLPGRAGQRQSAGQHSKGVVYRAGSEKTAGGSSKSPKSSWINGAKSVWKARTARGGSMVLLLSLVTGVYYINESHQKDRLMTALGYGLAKVNSLDLTDLYHQPAPSTISTPAHLPSQIRNSWQALNPQHHRFVDICLLPTRTYILASADIKLKPSQLIGSLKALRRPLMPRIKPIFYLLKIVVLPQLLTAFILWLILRFLLKDAELLDAQRERADIDDIEHEEALLPIGSPLPSTRLGSILKKMEATSVDTIDCTDVLEIWMDEGASNVIVADSDHKMRVLEDNSTMSVAFATYPGHKDLVYFDNSRKLLATASGKGKISLYDVKRAALKTTFSWDSSPIIKSPPCGIIVVDNFDLFATSWSVLTLHFDGSILSHSAESTTPILIAPSRTHNGRGRLLARRKGDWPRFAVLSYTGVVEEWELKGGNGWTVAATVAQENSVITDCDLISVGGDHFWLTSTEEGIIKLSTFPENQMLQEMSVSTVPIVKVRGISPSAERCERCALPRTSLPVDLVYWTEHTVGRCRFSFELPHIEVCMCARHPGGRASLSRPVDVTPVRALASVSKKGITSGSVSKQRSTSPSPMSRHGKLHAENGRLLGTQEFSSRTESEEETLIDTVSSGAKRDWVVHRLGHEEWRTQRGVAVLLPALNLIVAIGKVRREWQVTLIDLDGVHMSDSELSFPLEKILQTTATDESRKHRGGIASHKKLAFASVKTAAASTHTLLFAQGNALIRLHLPEPSEHVTSLSRRVSAIFSVPPSANGTSSSYGSRHLRSPIPLKLNGNSIPPH